MVAILPLNGKTGPSFMQYTVEMAFFQKPIWDVGRLLSLLASICHDQSFQKWILQGRVDYSSSLGRNLSAKYLVSNMSLQICTSIATFKNGLWTLAQCMHFCVLVFDGLTEY
jgi:hypothetical protein